MTRLSLTRIAAGATVAGLVALGASPAVALPHPFSPTSSTPPTSTAPSGQAGTGGQAGPLSSQGLKGIQQAADAAIAARINFLDKVVADLGKVPPGCSVGSLLATAQADITSLQQLKSTIDQDSTFAQAKMDAQKIFTDFRIYALVGPVDEMVVAACRISDVANKVEALVQKLKGVNDPNIASLLGDMDTEAQAAGAAVNGLGSTLEGYTPSDWNADHELLKSARQSLRTGREDLEKCRQDAHQILEIVRHDLNLGGKGGNGGSNVNPNTSTSSTSSTSSTTSTTA